MWDPDTYLGYEHLRARPFYDLIARVDALSPRRVVDLGCGPGNLTIVLARKWPSAVLEAIDASPEMIAAAKGRGIDARLADVAEWTPRQDTDVVVCNAVLQWVPEHQQLMRQWVAQLGRGAWIAVQMPGNFAQPSHTLARELAAESTWRSALGDVIPSDGDAVGDPVSYATALSAGCAVDVWETTYVQRLLGQDPVLEWITGTTLRPIRAALDDKAWDQFRAELAPRLRRAYPRQPDRVTWFPFRRIFAVARVR
ncbi:MAG: trans-aconitate 2-methyltransferase [Haloechinothrix sp.]